MSKQAIVVYREDYDFLAEQKLKNRDRTFADTVQRIIRRSKENGNGV